MATEFDDGEHWGFFLTGQKLTSETGKYVRMSSLVLAALRSAGVFSTMEDGTAAPATDKLWLDKNTDPPTLKEWDATGASWVPLTYGRLFGRAAIDKLTVTGGTENAVVTSAPSGFQASRLYLITPIATNTAATTIQVSGVGTFGVKYGSGADIDAGEFTAARQAVLYFTGTRFEVVFPVGDLNAAVTEAQGYASAASGSATAANTFAGAAAQSAAEAEQAAVGELVTRSANYTAVAGDINTHIRFTGAYTLALTAAATLGANWKCFVQADGGDVVIDPNGSETINGSSTLTVPNGTYVILWCNGTTFYAAGIANGSLTNAKLANMAQGTVKGRASGAGTGSPTDLSASELFTIISSLVTPKPQTTSGVGQVVAWATPTSGGYSAPSSGSWLVIWSGYVASNATWAAGINATIVAGGAVVQGGQSGVVFTGISWRIA
ncbi:hypothetical protein ACQKP1_15810 [Allorhizobium sp. NPDC080224]|uniref:hypothetical protein n=1 Tax=Allorhizobium sp. NPDC080224 TaxID=3390547 RepID=UPI003CFDDC2A